MKKANILNRLSIFIVTVLLIAQTTKYFYPFGNGLKCTFFVVACVLFVLNVTSILIFKKADVKNQIWSVGPTVLFVIYWLFELLD